MDPLIECLLFLFLFFREWDLVLIALQGTCSWNAQDITLLLCLPVMGHYGKIT